MVPDGFGVFQTTKGSVLCDRCRQGARASVADSVSLRRGSAISGSPAFDEGNVRITIGTLKGLRRLLQAPIASLGSLELGSSVGNEADGTLRLYMRQHFEEFKPIRSFEILRKFPLSQQKS